MDLASIKQASFPVLVDTFLNNKMLRDAAADLIQKRAYKAMVEDNPDGLLPALQEDRYLHMMGLMRGFQRACDRGIIAKNVRRRLVDVFIKNLVMNKEQDERGEELGQDLPMFLLVSPTGKCNLRCKGCYAESEPGCQGSLDFETFDRILREKKELWGSYFTVISGGEPFMWQDEGYDFLDMVERHPDNLWMVYTNGTLIDEQKAQRMAALGNISLVISLEGFREETDERRGEGVYDKILQAMENLRNAGVPFGMSVVPTRNNWDTILSDEFIDFFFNEQGVIYGWMFQYMPVGRDHTPELMPTPEQRLEMYKRTQRYIKDKEVFLVDFWNNAPSTNGCISAGRPGGYFYIDWNGNAMPCVFIPYSTHNMYNVYKEGGNLNDVLNCDFFKNIRQWQCDYCYRQSPEETNNLLTPCPVRDHHQVVRDAVLSTGAQPITQEAADALEDEGYREAMFDYDKEIQEKSQKIWHEVYKTPAHMP